jgi:hypothetical protein
MTGLSSSERRAGDGLHIAGAASQIATAEITQQPIAIEEAGA